MFENCGAIREGNEVDTAETYPGRSGIKHGGRGGGGFLGLIFAGYVPLASQNPYPIMVYSVAKYRPHLSHFWENVVFATPNIVTFCLCIYFIKPFN